MMMTVVFSEAVLGGSAVAVTTYVRFIGRVKGRFFRYCARVMLPVRRQRHTIEETNN